MVGWMDGNYLQIVVVVHLPLTNLRNGSQQSGLGGNRVEPNAAEPLLSSPLSVEGKQPCCREPVPVSEQDRAHSLHSGAAPRLSQKCTSETKRLSANNGFYNLVIQSPSLRDNSGRCVAKTDCLPPHCSAALVNDFNSNHATQGRAGAFCGLELRLTLWQFLLLWPPPKKLTSSPASTEKPSLLAT